jgi:hypothetical protein
LAWRSKPSSRAGGGRGRWCGRGRARRRDDGPGARPWPQRDAALDGQSPETSGNVPPCPGALAQLARAGTGWQRLFVDLTVHRVSREATWHWQCCVPTTVLAESSNQTAHDSEIGPVDSGGAAYAMADRNARQHVSPHAERTSRSGSRGRLCDGPFDRVPVKPGSGVVWETRFVVPDGPSSRLCASASAFAVLSEHHGGRRQEGSHARLRSRLRSGAVPLAGR